MFATLDTGAGRCLFAYIRPCSSVLINTHYTNGCHAGSSTQCCTLHMALRLSVAAGMPGIS